jgi:HPt (histidine-containing phosphotransfer) domain-containing protein
MSEQDAPLDARTIQELRRLQVEYGNPDFLNQLVKMFLENAPRRMGQIGEAIGRTDASTLEHVAHTLKSNCAMLGASRMAAMCAELEKLGEAETLSEAQTIYQNAQKEFERVCAALEKLKLIEDVRM